jgi:diguanylate cyclase (GGDEF)-like protein
MRPSVQGTITNGKYRNISSDKPQRGNLVKEDSRTSNTSSTETEALRERIVSLEERMIELEAIRADLEAKQAHLVQVNHRLTGLATRDGLTNAYNHRAFREKLAEELARSRRRNEPISLVMVDLDDFKAYNDQFGHPAGDVRLKEFVQTVLRQVRSVDFVARYGGEEFVIVLPNTKISESAVIATRILDELRLRTGEHRLTASFGCAELNPTTRRADQLIEEADQALYAAKSNGKNCVKMFQGG